MFIHQFEHHVRLRVKDYCQRHIFSEVLRSCELQKQQVLWKRWDIWEWEAPNCPSKTFMCPAVCVLSTSDRHKPHKPPGLITAGETGSSCLTGRTDGAGRGWSKTLPWIPHSHPLASLISTCQWPLNGTCLCPLCCTTLIKATNYLQLLFRHKDLGQHKGGEGWDTCGLHGWASPAQASPPYTDWVVLEHKQTHFQVSHTGRVLHLHYKLTFASSFRTWATGLDQGDAVEGFGSFIECRV